MVRPRPATHSSPEEEVNNEDQEHLMASVQERVIAVTARVLQLDPTEIKLEDHFTTDLGAESVQSVELVANFEEEFGIDMEEDAALSVTNVGEAVKFITEVCKQQGRSV
jgi:acyl carrier protein